jgi:hypothetical protein
MKKKIFIKIIIMSIVLLLTNISYYGLNKKEEIIKINLDAYFDSALLVYNFHNKKIYDISIIENAYSNREEKNNIDIYNIKKFFSKINGISILYKLRTDKLTIILEFPAKNLIDNYQNERISEDIIKKIINQENLYLAEHVDRWIAENKNITNIFTTQDKGLILEELKYLNKIGEHLVNKQNKYFKKISTEEIRLIRDNKFKRINFINLNVASILLGIVFVLIYEIFISNSFKLKRKEK